MRNRIKGYWSWDEVGILPSELAPATGVATPARHRLPARARPSSRATAQKQTITTAVVVGTVVVGLAIVWGLGALIRRI